MKDLTKSQPKLLLDQNWAQNFFNSHSKIIFGKDINVKIEKIERSQTFNTESYNVLYTVLTDVKKTFRASASTQADREPTYQALKYIYDHGFNTGDLLVPRPIGYFAEQNAFFYENVEGETFMHNLNNTTQDLISNMTQIALALKKFHNIKLPDFPLWEQDWGLNIQAIAKYYPKLAKQAEDIKSNILNKINHFNKKDFCHGDYQPNNLIFRTNKLYIIDFGSVCALPKEMDIASFVLQLKIMLKKYNNLQPYEELKEKFLLTYQDFNQELVDLYKVLLSFRILDYFIVFPKNENNADRISFGYELVKENLAKISINLDD